jgi:hypothetical protein
MVLLAVPFLVLVPLWDKFPPHGPFIGKSPTNRMDGPNHVVKLYNSSNREEREMLARRAFELVQAFLKLF